MLLYIHDQLLIDQIQERFQECFSGLRIVFYSRIQNRRDPAAIYRIPGSRYVGDVRVNHRNGILEIKSWYTVSRVEKALKEEFDLEARVFRGNEMTGWVQVNANADQTLRQLCLPTTEPVG